MGGNDGGFSFYVQNGKLTYGYNYVADKHFKIESKEPLPKGHHLFSFEFEPTGKADVAEGQGHAGHDQAARRRQGGGPRRPAGDDPHSARPRRGR